MKNASGRARRSAGKRSPIQLVAAGATTASPTAKPRRETSSMVKLAASAAVAVRADHTAIPHARSWRRLPRSASRPSARPTSAYSQMNAEPSSPIWPSVRWKSLRMGSVSAPMTCRSWTLRMFTAVRTGRAGRLPGFMGTDVITGGDWGSGIGDQGIGGKLAAMSIFRENLLRGGTAFVTGGGTGIGRRMAERFAAHGARVVLAGRRAEKLDEAARDICAAGGTADTASLDVRDYEAVAAALRRTHERFGPVDILLCAAAGNFPAPVTAMSANGFKAVIDIDLLGTFNTCRAAHEFLRKPGA